MVTAQQEILIGVSFFSSVHSYLWGMVNYFVRLEANNHGLRLITRTSDNTVEMQVKQIQELLDHNIDALIIAAKSSDAPELIALIKKVHASGIPVIAMDSIVGNGDFVCTVSADNIHCQYAVAMHLFKQLGGQGKIAHIQGAEHLRSAHLRTEGLRQAMAHYPNIELVYEKHGNYLDEKAYELMLECLEMHQDLDAVIAANDLSAEGIIKALEEAQLTKPVLVTGFDAHNLALIAMRKGKMAVTVKYDPRQLASLSVRTALRVLNGEAVPTQQFMPVELVTTENLDEAMFNHLEILPDFVGNLSRTNEKLQAEIEERKRAQATLNRYAAELEQRNEERKKTQRALKTYADELERSNQELQNFALIASHDLREPLRKIHVFGSRLQENYGHLLDSRGLNYLERMQSGSARMRILIEDLLAYSSLSTTAQSFQMIDLNHILQDVLEDIKLQIQESDADIYYNDLPTVEANPTQMGQLFQNLLSNALKFHQENENPVVHINSQPLQRDVVQIEVADEGIGFEPEFADRIFGMFQRLHTRSSYEGTGIGLAVCHKIVEQHNGRIAANSTPGEGTVFTITLPIKQSQLQQRRF